MAASRHVRLLISGRVQGVWFRASTREVATDLGLRGWVRNLPDGCVEVTAQGPDSQVESLITWCHQGPPGSRVGRVEVSEVEAADEGTGFEVRW